MANPLTTDQIFISKLTEIILANIQDENFGVNELVRESGLSLYKLSRKLHSINKKTINRFIREVRLEKAREMLRDGEYTASEVAYKTGFSSPAYFTKRFHEYYGYPPGKAKSGDTSEKELNAQTAPVGGYVPGRDVRRALIRSYPGLLFMGLILAAVVYVIYNLFNKPGSEGRLGSGDGRISIAIMPFRNMTNDTIWDIWQPAIQTNLITSLSNSEELKVRQIETINGLLKGKGITDYASINPPTAGPISRKLDADVFVLGSINQAGGTIRLNSQVINSKTEDPLNSFQIDGPSESILDIIDSLSGLIRNSLVISKIKNERPDITPLEQNVPTTSSEAYRYFILGKTAFYRNDFPAAIDYYLQALEIDSSLVAAMSGISLAFYNDVKYEQAREWCLRSHEKTDLMTPRERISNNALYAVYFGTLNDRIRYLKQLLDFDDQNPMTYFNIGDCYFEMFEYEKAIPEFEKALDVFHKWGIKPYWGAFYYELGITYHRTGQYKKEKRLYRKADRDFPGDPGLMDQYAWLDLALGDTAAANRHLNDLISVRREESWSDARIASYLAYVYDMAGMPKRVEEQLRKALALEPENPVRMSGLANFLIDRDRNIDEGLRLVEKALQLQPGNYNFLHNKGWGLYKQGKYREALEYLERSWALRPLYSHRIYLHLEEAKKAAARQL